MDPFKDLNEYLQAADKNLQRGQQIDGLTQIVSVLIDATKNLKLETSKQYKELSRNINTISLTPGPRGVQGEDGPAGYTPVKGKDYRDGEDGYSPVKGIDYVDGKDGEKGDMPSHEWDGTKLRFQLPGGKWGKWTDLQGKDGVQGFTMFGGGGGPSGIERVKSSGIVIREGASEIDFGTGLTVTRSGNGVRVDATATGGGAWGTITGTLSAQTDLQSALDGKANSLGADDNYVTDAQLVVIGNTSGTNTGDNAVNTLYSGLAASKQDTLVSATNIKTINGNSLLGAGDLAITAGYTNLTEFIAQTAWRVFYSDGSGDVKELALGADGTFLKSNGAAAAPTFATPSGSGDVSKVGTPLNNQIGVWTGDGTIEGDASLTWDGTSLNIATAKNFQIAGGTVLADAAGTLTLSGIDAIDATTEATIEAAIDTLANLTSVQGLTVTLADAGADALLGWDDSASAYQNLSAADAKTALALVKGDVGLGSVDNTADAAKAVLTATKWATARNLAGNSVDGSANVAFANKFIVQGTADAGLSAAQFLGALGTGIVKNTTTTGVLSIAVAGDFPTLNQSTTGSAATLTTPRAIYGNNFDGSAALAQIIASTYGGTGNGFTKFSGPTTAEKTFTLPDSNATLLYSGGALGTPSSGTLTNATGLPLTGLVSDTTTALGIGSINLGHASDTTITRVSAGVVAIEGVNILTVAGGTLTGNITLGENTSIDLDPAGSADGKYSGICITGTAGTTLAFGDLIYLAVADSRWELTDADAAATADVLIGICVLAAAGDGSATKILLQGQIRADAKFPALTIGSPVYVGETAGAVQVAIPTGADNVIRRVGFALTADEMYFNPSQDSQVTVA